MGMIDTVFGGQGPAKSLPGKIAKMAIGRMLTPLSGRLRLRGAYGSYDEAMANARKNKLAGYDNDEITEISFEAMCRMTTWDYPVLYWLQRLAPETRRLLDAGGHMGTKYRAFANHLDLDRGLNWVIYDVPAIVRAGRERAKADGLDALSFIDNLGDAGDIDVMLASGLLQYIDRPFKDFMGELPRLPKHLVLNKVATREGPTVVSLENFGVADVPYQVRDRVEFLAQLDELGYDVIDRWTIPSLSHVIPTHLELGASTSRGFYARLRDS